MVRRRAVVLALVIPCASIGCHAGSANNLAKPAPAPIKTQEAISKDRFIAMHNSNARAIQSLRASPRIELTEGLKDRPRSYSLRGRMALERPQAFNLEIAATANTSVAKIGSNDQGFWFWVKDNEEREIYTCAHENLDASPLAATFQPDWIIEAMGLRVIDAAEAKVISAQPGDRPDTLILTQLRKDAHGEMLTKETVVNVRDGSIVAHRLYSGAKAHLLANATISEYGHMKMEATAENPTERIINYPSRFRLEWVEEGFALEIKMEKTIFNPKFDEGTYAALFTEPTVPGYTRVDLATRGGVERASAPAPSSRIHETRPSPRSGSSIRLEAPQPLGDGAMQTSAEPLALGSIEAEDLLPDPTLEDAPRPRPVSTAPAPAPPQTASSAGLNRLRGPKFGR
ncbi:hypothetical protein TA3x_000989 [Tundrisphaera sp. TA3]|uniref:hypothetical protein n=1 Tax=Tundrisphaera sp. TA3 TaxID=3435775 RepID=UPI003EC1429D